MKKITPSLKRITHIIIIEAALAAIWLLLIPKDPVNAVFLGYSLRRLALLILIVFLALVALGFWMVFRRSKDVQKWFSDSRKRVITANVMRNFGFILAIIIWSFLLFYFYLRLVDDIGIYFRLLPIMVLYLLFALQAMLFVPLYLYPTGEKKKTRIQKISLRAPIFWIVLSILMLIFGIIELTGLGKDPLWVSTSTLGVPLLECQIWYTIGVLVLIVIMLYSRSAIPGYKERKNKKYEDIAIFIGLWALAVILWMSLPLPEHNYFAPSVRPPTYLKYPFSDAEQYAYNSLYVLFGAIEDFVISKPLYVSFLSVLHFIGGYDYNTIIFLQTLVLAFLPSVGYLIGRELHSRIVGVGVALLLIMREMTGILSSTIANVSNSKLLLSDVPATLVMALITLVIIRWFKKTDKKISYSIFILGGLTAVLNLMRIQTMALIPFMVIVILIRLFGDWRKITAGIGIFFLTIGLLLTPILIRNYSITGVFWIDNPKTSSGVYRFLSEGTDIEVDHSQFDSGEEIMDRIFNVVGSTFFENPGQMALFASDHFMRNVISTFQIFPIRIGNQISWIEYFAIRGPFWAEVYTEPNILNFLITIVNIAILALGFTVLWKRKPILPVMLILIYSIYNLSSSIVRLSGWRFIQPVDWIIYIFFVVGVVELITWLVGLFFGENTLHAFFDWDGNKIVPIIHVNLLKRYIIFGIAFILACGFIPLRENLLPATYPVYKMETICWEISNHVERSKYIELLDAVNNLCLNGDAKVHMGYGFYPRFFDKNEGYYDRSWDPSFGEQEYSRLVFRVAGYKNGNIYIKTNDDTIGFKDGDIVYAIVRNEHRVGASIVVIPGEETHVIISPEFKLENNFVIE